MRITACILLASLAAPALASTPAALDGSWTTVRAERDGTGVAELVGHRLRLDGNHFEIADRQGQLLYTGTYRADATVQPAQIDFHHAGGQATGQVWEGIYRLDGNRLTIVDDAPDPQAPRPSGFSAGKGSGYVLLEFER